SRECSMPPVFDFGNRTLPYGVFRPPGLPPRVGVAVDDLVLDLSMLVDSPEEFEQSSLNAFMAKGRQRWRDVRAVVEARVRDGVGLGYVVGVPSEQGVPVPAGEFRDHVFGAVALLDWSARDIQAWEYQPLGPFLGKSFATTVSSWVVPLEALDDAWVDGPCQEPAVFPY